MKKIMAKSLSVIIPVCNEAETISGVIQSAKGLNPIEIIVVANGCNDGTEEIADRLGCKVIKHTELLGNDVGRAVGAKHAIGDVLLFIDGDFVIPTSKLQLFLNPILHDQADIVLNNLDALFLKRKKPNSITVWRQILNAMLEREELKIDSLLDAPHALTKEVVQSIGYESFVNPIVAHLRLVQSEWRISRHCTIDVITPNKFRPTEHDAYGTGLSRFEKRMIGDHIEAVAERIVDSDERGGYYDGNRKRDSVYHTLDFEDLYQGWGITSKLYKGKQLSVIIPVQDEEKTIGNVIDELRKIEPFEIIVVVNGSSDQTATIAKEKGATTIVYKEALGNDVGRSLGTYFAKGDMVLFVDGDFVIPARELYPFAKAIADGMDVALNDLNHYLDLRVPLHLVTAFKYALNLACDRKDLGVGSLIAVPNAFSRKCLKEIGYRSLLSPCVAQVKAILLGFEIACVSRVEVDKMNRIRPSEHFAKIGHPPAVLRIIGDHIEGLEQLIVLEGNRGGFYDGNRKRDVLE
ncbi:glycosyl transferase [Bacillus sp. AFS094611]|uniref:Glycosyl transferase n=3 Tax=Bacillaceae TaxID=186817 RepID=A0A2A7DEE6_BACAN|nr:glycosyl transferase [Bacillus thuringiensis serovar coreanensis]OTX47854.1 glycosyl transferase [Bacillus thuringiensis serovar sooncheon]OTX54844.1 glycosyl transferase [Bacillus thuringiensis serovar guiyangiensis]OTX68899.1 glycosyl transferase [Bacillus thuringiensis serovar roskildiensis]PDZ18311.1 glycosyl transferase [Bacillus anthracis]PDZ50132.1 glycosyl transferase [Bacillus sp. AFS094611]